LVKNPSFRGLHAFVPYRNFESKYFKDERMKHLAASILITICCFFLGCSKEENNGGDNRADGLYPTELKGTIYYAWATEGILKISLPDGTGGSFIPDDSKLNNFDISRDGKTKLTVVNASTLGQYDVRFTISDINTGAVVEEFIYNGPGLSAYCKGHLSPDNSLILVTSNEKEDGITVLKRNGEFLSRIVDINGERVDFNVSALWLPDNHFLMTHGDYIIRVAPPYTSGTLVKEMDYDLLLGSYYRYSGEGFGRLWQLSIIPNDGRQYTTNPDAEDNSPGVIPVIWKGKEKIETGSGQMVWR